VLKVKHVKFYYLLLFIS